MDEAVKKKLSEIIDEINAAYNKNFDVMLHEFEGILFSNPESFELIAETDVVNKIREIRESYPTPEHINNSPEMCNLQIVVCMLSIRLKANKRRLSVLLNRLFYLLYIPDFAIHHLKRALH